MLPMLICFVGSFIGSANQFPVSDADQVSDNHQ
jgi:hypothetical protein